MSAEWRTIVTLPDPLPPLNFAEQRALCNDGELPNVLWPPPDGLQELGEYKLRLFESYCPCPEDTADLPTWVKQLRISFLSGQALASNINVFSALLQHDGLHAADRADAALDDYRRNHKGFWRIWKAIHKASRDTMLHIGEHGNQVVIRFDEQDWQDFLANLAQETANKLRDQVRDQFVDRTLVRGSETAQIRFKSFTFALDALMAAKMIHDSVEAHRLASLPKNHPDAIEKKVDLILERMAEGPEQRLRLERQYWAYDRAHWRLRHYRDRELALRSDADQGSRQSNMQPAPPEYELLSTLFPADMGL